MRVNTYVRSTFYIPIIASPCHGAYEETLFCVDVEYPPPDERILSAKLTLRTQPVASFESRGNERESSSVSFTLSLPFFLINNAMSTSAYASVFLICLWTIFSPRASHCATNVSDVSERTQAEDALAKLVKMFSKPGAFKQVGHEDSLKGFLGKRAGIIS